jgi:hypothetical protein
LNAYFKWERPPPQIAFRVRQGRISSIGSVFMAPVRLFRIRDGGQRDLAMFLARNPAVRSQAIVAAPARIVADCGPGPEVVATTPNGTADGRVTTAAR